MQPPLGRVHSVGCAIATDQSDRLVRATAGVLCITRWSCVQHDSSVTCRYVKLWHFISFASLANRERCCTARRATSQGGRSAGVLKRSQLAVDQKTLDEEGDFADDRKKSAKHENPWERFSEYQGLVESESVEIENLVMCDDEEVLRAALNADLHTHGIVSYLYTKKSGSLYGEETNSSVAMVEYKNGDGKASGGWKGKLPKLFERDSEESSDEEVDKALARVNAAKEKI
ncbi:hypothetical protein FGB62_356g02 [Gracilaria domingensis]|nr:hypothetical protein FGB62_356g02 [Gracilaria domingensis]